MSSGDKDSRSKWFFQPDKEHTYFSYKTQKEQRPYSSSSLEAVKIIKITLEFLDCSFQDFWKKQSSLVVFRVLWKII